MTPSEIYSALVASTHAAESITWNRFYCFLTGNSILVIAWGVLFASAYHSDTILLALILICLFGIFLGICFSALGYRGRRFLNEYIKLGAKMERDATCYPAPLAQYGFFTKTVVLRDKDLSCKWSGSFYILTIAPLIVATIHVFLLIASLSRWTIVDLGHFDFLS